jgi:general secretion pathway protein I
MRTMRPLHKLKAFTLLEVLVAMSILGISLMAIFDINAQAVASHIYAKKLTVATLLARGKMIDIEQKMHDEGLPADDDEDSGDFKDEGWPSYKWRARIIVPKTNGLAPEQLFGALFGIPMGDGSDPKAGADPLALLSGMFGAGKKPDPSANPGAAGAGGGLLAMMGPMAGVAQQQFTQMIDQLQKSVREVHLTVSWKEGNLTESIDLVTHVVSLGQGSDRNGGPINGQATTQTFVRPDGTPARKPQTCASGAGMCDEDGAQLVSSQQQGQGGLVPGLQGLNPDLLKGINPNLLKGILPQGNNPGGGLKF